MGQKINSNIFRLGIKQNEWNSKYFEKSKEEATLYNFNDLQLKAYINKFLNTQGILLHNLKIKYTGKILFIFVSFFITKRTLFIINEINSLQKIKLKRKRKKRRKKKKRYSRKEWRRKKLYKKRTRLIKRYKNFLKMKTQGNYHKFLKNFFFEQIFESISLYTKNKYHIYLVCQNINTKDFMSFKRKEKRVFKRRLFSLRRYRKTQFFRESINILILISKLPNSSYLLANYIANQLSKTKKHVYYIIFLKRALNLIIKSSFSKIKGIKIVVRGRLNKKPRSKKKLILIGRHPIQTLKSKISYSEATSYTQNGTLGIKVWICEK